MLPSTMVLVCKISLYVFASIITVLWLCFGSGEFNTRGIICCNILSVYTVGFPGLTDPLKNPKTLIIFILQYFPLSYYGFYLITTYYINLHLLIGYIIGVSLIILTWSTIYLPNVLKRFTNNKPSSPDTQGFELISKPGAIEDSESSENEVRIIPFNPPIESNPPNVIHQTVVADVHQAQDDEIPKMISVKKKVRFSRSASWSINYPAAPVVSILTSMFSPTSSSEASRRSKALESEVTFDATFDEDEDDSAQDSAPEDQETELLDKREITKMDFDEISVVD